MTISFELSFDLSTDERYNVQWVFKYADAETQIEILEQIASKILSLKETEEKLDAELVFPHSPEYTAVIEERINLELLLKTLCQISGYDMAEIICLAC